ncbi:phospholipase effector Tle1 domain-containing protein [Flavobacterium sp.]|uniref:phospholipase effector Tle1 domain-containing protein n=1 Tax=Flavobacterium sp. TaxID=239 RepID=UPI00286E3662|nr:DUF2235 domain-containing protein [Flavobacterium sp.]
MIKDKNLKENEYVNEMELTVFGFSRGAAAARNFISQRFKLQDMYDIESNKLNFSFVGLFDTVSSYSENFSVSPNFDDDVEGKKGLNLKMYGNVQKVVHLTAGDEYRAFFSLTNIKSSIEAGVGFELELPGVHSDIGGGYAEIEIEKRQLHFELGYYNIKENLIAQGWYDPNQITTVEKEVTLEHGIKVIETEHYAKRTIPLHYQFIPLAIMVQLSEKHGLQFDKRDLEKGVKKDLYAVPDDLKLVKQQMMNFANTNDGAHSKAIKVSDAFKPIRKKYLHRSASTATGKNGRYKDGKPYRKPIDG